MTDRKEKTVLLGGGAVMGDVEPSFDLLKACNDMPLGKAAEFYAKIGFRVIALEPEGKAPIAALAKRWTKRGTSDIDTIREWWKTWPDANIGLLPEGTPWIVLDLDVKRINANGVTAFSGLHEELGGPTAATPSGGVHRWFERTEDPRIRNRSPRKAGFDLLVTARQAVAPPSVVRDKRGKLVKYRWTGQGAPAPMPMAVLDKIDELRSATANENQPEDAPVVPNIGGAVVIEHSHTLITDDRSHGAFDLAGHLAQFHGDRPDADILATVWDIDEYRQAALDRRHFQDSAVSWLWVYCVWPAMARRIDPTKLVSDGHDPRPHAVIERMQLVDARRSDPAAGIVFLSPTDLTTPDLANHFIVADMVQKEGLNVLYGPPGSGKSFIAMDIWA